jgi:hypothetical protein
MYSITSPLSSSRSRKQYTALKIHALPQGSVFAWACTVGLLLKVQLMGVSVMWSWIGWYDGYLPFLFWAIHTALISQAINNWLWSFVWAILLCNEVLVIVLSSSFVLLQSRWDLVGYGDQETSYWLFLFKFFFFGLCCYLLATLLGLLL